MVIKSLELENFRNYETLLINFDSGTNILYGDNAQGKTNILEAIFVSATTKSHKGSKDRDIVNSAFDEAHIRTYVLKDGLMKYDIGNTNTNLGDGKYHLMYRGSFYTINNNQENLYIIDDNGYLYKIEDFKEDSPVIIKRVTNNTIKRLGIRSITDENHFATDRSNILIEFSDDEILEITEIYEFELLNG